VLKLGFYANESTRMLDVFVEAFDDDVIYQEKFNDYFKPGYMKDPIDFYLTHKIKPNVVQFKVGMYPVLNGVFVDHAPILFETGDHLELKYKIQKMGKVGFN